MKKFCGVLLLFLAALFICGCKPDDSWNGVYTNDSNYDILIYTNDDKIASIMVKETGTNYEFYPIQYSNYLNVEENKLKARAGTKLVVTKTENTIVIKVDSEEKGEWAKFEGTYTKQKNSRGFNTNQF